MEKIHKFKKEVLSIVIYSMIDYYPGNPYYIGKDSDEEFKKSVAKMTFEEHKGHLEKSDFTLFKEVMTNDEVNHYYVGFMSDATLNSMYDDARFAIGSLTLEKLKYELQILDSYNYKELVEELDQLSLKFNRGSTDKGDVYRFKANIKKHFKYDLGHTGKITTTFVGCLKSELKKRTKYLEALKADINKMIAILMESVEPLPSKTHPANTDLRLSNNIEPIKDNTMDINYERIFEIALSYADEHEEMKAFCIREQKIADRDFFYKREDFYKGFLKIVADKKELAKYQPGPSPTHIGSFFIAGGGGSGYKYESIELVEQVINEIWNEEKNTSKPFHISETVLMELQKNGFIKNAHEAPITWLKNKQLLRELLLNPSIKKDIYTVTNVADAAPLYFVDKYNKPFTLSNNKPEPSIDSDLLVKICDHLYD